MIMMVVVMMNGTGLYPWRYDLATVRTKGVLDGWLG